MRHSANLERKLPLRDREFSVLIGFTKSALLKLAIYLKNDANSLIALWLMSMLLVRVKNKVCDDYHVISFIFNCNTVISVYYLHYIR